jgi:hypothetical protein
VSEDLGHQLLGAGPLELRPTGDPEGCVDLNLPGLLSRLLAQGDGTDSGKTRAQRLIEAWIVEALKGNPRVLEDILDRTEKGRLAGASAAAAPPPIDDQTASKILEVLCGDGEGPAGD